MGDKKLFMEFYLLIYLFYYSLSTQGEITLEPTHYLHLESQKHNVTRLKQLVYSYCVVFVDFSLRCKCKVFLRVLKTEKKQIVQIVMTAMLIFWSLYHSYCFMKLGCWNATQSGTVIICRVFPERVALQRELEKSAVRGLVCFCFVLVLMWFSIHETGSCFMPSPHRVKKVEQKDD